ncbi:MAG TPA: DUF3306 domain-containing protein [Usitatibacter sp.]|nr:DUF3306 domain-containing protein [Usitatibacter sp.]
MSDDNFLSRWSRRKIRARRGDAEAQEPEATPRAAEGETLPAAAAPAPPAPLPAIESLTPDSDYTPFMRADVDADTRRLAMRKLFEDPRFNVMDGLDVYIDDYSKPDPLPEGWLEKMTQVARLGIFKPAPETQPEPGLEASVEGSAPAEAPLLPASETATGEAVASVTSVKENDALPVPKSPAAGA